MKTTKKIADFVIAEVAGQDTLDLVKYLKGKENISEFVIAKDLEKEINQTRNMLYRLLHANLVSFTRKKDKQKGWYIYYWTFEPNNIQHLYWEIKKKRLDSLKDRLSREKNTVFFISPSGNMRLEFDKAVAFDYRCPETGEMLVQQDNSAIVKQLEVEIKELQSELKTRVMPGAKKPIARKKVSLSRATDKLTKKKTIARKA